MSATILQGNVLDTLPTLEPESVDVCVTSPPYWRLRSYLPKDHPLKPLELGSEATPAEFVANQVAVMRLVRRALAPHGTVWLNIGDSYASNSTLGRKDGGKSTDGTRRNPIGRTPNDGPVNRTEHVAEGNLCLIPQRLAIALQDDGWLVRSVIIWHKPACMPASLSGWAWRRCRVKLKNGNQTGSGKQAENRLQAGFNERYHGTGQPPRTQRVYDPAIGGQRYAQPEWQDCPGCKKCSPHGGYVLRRGSWRPTSSWEPILMLAKGPGYFCDGEPVKTPPAAATVSRDQYTRVLDDPDEQFAVAHDHETICDGANARDVQTWAAEPLREAHYAAFPTALVSFCLRAGTSAKGYCPACGSPWCRVIEKTGGPPTGDHRLREDFHETEYNAGAHPTGMVTGGALSAAYAKYGYPETKTIGWRPSCSCIGAADMAPRPGKVLDPFCGSGRSGIEARRLGLDFVGCELNETYVEMARRLLVNDSPLFAGVE